MNLIEGAKLSDSKTTGFIVSLKESNRAYQEIIDQNLSNFFVSSWVPQKELLAQPKLKLFCTHGGSNSLMESMYFGTPLLGFGLEGDQFGNLGRTKRLGVSKFGYFD